MQGHGKQQMALVSFLVGLHSVAMRPSAPVASPACDEGYYQRDPIVLTCQGGAEKKMLQLTKAGTAHSFFYWRAPTGTKDLQATFTLSAVEHGHKGLAALEINCNDKHSMNKKKLVEHANGTLLNAQQATGKDFLSNWSWSGNPKHATAGRFEVWFRVNGTLHCDIEVHLANTHASRLHGYIEYTWAGIRPCPEFRLGCVPCPKDYCDAGNRAHCHGDQYVECRESPAEVPASASEASEAEQSSSTSRSTTSPVAVANSTRSSAGDSGSAELSETTAKPSSNASTVPTAPPGQQKIEGLFEINAKIGSGTDVTRRSFKLVIKAALATALGVPRSSLVRFRVVDVTSVVGAASSKSRLLQSHRDVVLAVAYRLLLPEKREDQLIAMLKNMGKGNGSGVLGHFSKILGSHGVSVNAFKAVYPPSWVTEEEEEEEAKKKASGEAPGDDLDATTTLGAPMQSPMVKGIQSPKLPEGGAVALTTTSPETLTEPTWSSTQKVFMVGFAALLGAIAICGICALLQMYNLRTTRASHLDSSSAYRNRRGDDLNRVSSTSEDRHLLDMDTTQADDSPGRNERGFPSGYEPVGQDGGRYIGNEGM